MNVLRWDIKIQIRYGFYYAAAIMVITWIAVLWSVSADVMIDYIPAFLLSNLNLGTFYFVGAMILFEKIERTLDPLQISPLRQNEYISSKVGSLILLGLLENVIIIAVLFRDISMNYFWVFFGIIGMGGLYTLFGIGFAVKYHNITDYLFPSIPIVFLLELPIFQFFGVTGGIWDIIYYLMPLQPLVVLTQMAITPIPVGELIYGILGTAFWFAFAYRYATNRFEKYVVRKEVS